MIKLNITPTYDRWPTNGGVREHLRLLHNAVDSHPNLCCVNGGHYDVAHVESAFVPQTKRIDVYVCHGGFEPRPLRVVYENLKKAKIIISVSKWIVDKYFPEHARKTVVIHNGVDLGEWDLLEVEPNNDLAPGYILYAKEGCYYFADLIRLAIAFPNERFVSTVWPSNILKPENVTVIGLQSKIGIRSVLSKASVLLLTGPEVCPTMLMEAWASGVPVLAQNIRPSGSAELMKGSNGKVYGGALYDSTNMVHQLNYCLYNSVDLGMEGHLEVVSRFNWWKQFEKYVEVYDRVQAFN